MIELRNKDGCLTQLRGLPDGPVYVCIRKLFRSRMKHGKLNRCFNVQAMAGTHHLHTTAGAGAKGGTFILTVIICRHLFNNCSFNFFTKRQYIFGAWKHAQQ